MATQTLSTAPIIETAQPYVITCGDEGVQINVGRRLAFVGAGLKLEGFPQVVKELKKLFGKELAVVSSSENDWTKKQFSLSNWEQTDATAQQQLELLADELGLNYAGFLPFADPRQLKHDVKGHMVRPRKVHIANTICFTLAGGEKIFHLGHFLVSAEWVSAVKPQLAKQIIQTQIEFYTQISGQEKLDFTFELEGDLGKTLAAKNQAVVEKILKSK